MIFVCSSVTDNLTVRCGQHLYIASQEAMRKEDFLHGRTFEGSNSPRAGVKANNDILRRKAQKGLFMEEKAKVTAAPTIAEQCGIKYKEVDGLFYPILGESDQRSYASLGKYGHRYLRVLMENDRYLYNKYFMQGVLFDKAAEYENYAWQLYDTVLQGISKVRGIGLDTLEEKGFQVTFHENMQAAMTADEIVTEDLFATIDYNKRVRLEHAKENIAFEDAETQRMEA